MKVVKFIPFILRQTEEKEKLFQSINYPIYILSHLFFYYDNDISLLLSPSDYLKYANQQEQKHVI